MDQECLIALGSNLAFGKQSPVENCQTSLLRIVECGVRLRRVSRFFQTPAFPVGAGPDYINAVVAGEWAGTADGLLQALHRIENVYDRQRTTRWGARTLDLDLLTLGQKVLPSHQSVTQWVRLSPTCQANQTPDRLILPHPRMQDRAFVLVPMRDVEPDWQHPLTGATVTEMVDALAPQDVAAITPL